jgi:hypothetical protein
MLGDWISDMTGGTPGIVDAGPTPPTDTSTQPSLISQLVTGFTQLKLAQSQLSTVQQWNQMNLQRVAAGQAPIPYDPSMFAQPGVSVGLSSNTQQLVTYGLLGVGGLLLLNMLMKRRR